MNELHIKGYFHLHSSPNILKMVLFTKNEVGGTCYVRDEQDVDKAFWLENLQENIFEMWTNKVRTS